MALTEIYTKYKDFLLKWLKCNYFVEIRVYEKYVKTKVKAQSIEEVEQIIKKTIIGNEYQIMNVYKEK